MSVGVTSVGILVLGLNPLLVESDDLESVSAVSIVWDGWC